MPLMMTPPHECSNVHFHDALCTLLNTLFSARGGYHDVYDNYQLLFSLVLLIYPDLSTPYVDPPFLYTTFACWFFSQISEHPRCFSQIWGSFPLLSAFLGTLSCFALRITIFLPQPDI